MFGKIARRSFYKQYKNYLIYFLCITLAVMSFYSFSALTDNQSLVKSVWHEVGLSGAFASANFFVAMLVLLFMFSANHFFLEQRQKEFGIYQLHGLKKSKIIWQVLVETFILNSFALVVGIVAGILFSKLFMMILIRAMGIDLIAKLFISKVSMRSTCVFFLVALSLILFRNMWFIGHRPLIAFLQKDEQKLGKKLRVRWYHWVIGAFSLVLIGIGYTYALLLPTKIQVAINSTEEMKLLLLPFIIFGLCVVGTYGFFFASLNCLFVLITKVKRFSLRGLRMFTIHNARKGIQKNWRALSLVTITVGVAIALIGLFVGGGSLYVSAVKLQHPTDFQVQPQVFPALEKVLAETNTEVEATFNLHAKMTNARLVLNQKMVEVTDSDFVDTITLVSISEYERFRQFKPDVPQLTLDNQTSAIYLTSLNFLNQRFIDYDPVVTLPKQQQVILQSVDDDYFGAAAMRYYRDTLIVSDEVYAQNTGQSYQITYVDIGSFDSNLLHQRLQEALPENWLDTLTYHCEWQEGVLTERFGVNENEPAVQSRSRINYVSGDAAFHRARQNYGILLYVCLFLGMITLIMTAGMLALRYLSQAPTEQKEFSYLALSGVDNRVLYRTVCWQIGLFFTPVALLAVLHGSLAVRTMMTFATSSDYWVAYAFGSLALLVYLIIYFLTVHFYWRTLKK